MACACAGKKNGAQSSARSSEKFIVVSQSGTQRTFRKKADAEKFAQRTGGKVKTG